MSINVFPVAVTSSSSINASSITCASPHTVYSSSLSLEPAIYTVTCTTSTIAQVYFYSGISTLVASATTVSGTVAVQVPSSVSRVLIWTNTGSNIVVTITKVASALTNAFSGTLDIITSSTTYTGTSTSGYAYAVLIGGGGGGGGSQWNRTYAGNGGTGGVCSKLVELTGSMAVVIGSGGIAGTHLANGGNGGTSTFAGMSAGGGIGGSFAGGESRTHGAGGVATGGDFNQSSTGSTQLTGPNTPFTWSFVTPNASGSIGTGGIGSNYYGSGKTDPTGYGAGGGGSETRESNGQVSTGTVGGPGVLLILRF
jgi:hypothetical protein